VALTLCKATTERKHDLTESTNHERLFPTMYVRQSAEEQEKAALSGKYAGPQKDEEKQ
jgi:hypothetical protein